VRGIANTAAAALSRTGACATLALLAALGVALALSASASSHSPGSEAHQASAMPSTSAGARHVGLGGYGSAAWWMRVRTVERHLGIGFDCSKGVAPGTCICPESDPELPVTVVFNRNRLVALFETDPAVTTTAGIHVGSRTAAVRRAYPRARLIKRGGLTGGLSTYFRYRRNGHVLTFTVSGHHVGMIAAFASRSWVEGELCA
jgi:hypothetical protein